MTATLLDQFIGEECTPYVRTLLVATLSDATQRVKRFEFNRFEICIDRDKGVVLVEDVLDATSTGALAVPIAEFAAALKGRAT